MSLLLSSVVFTSFLREINWKRPIGPCLTQGPFIENHDIMIPLQTLQHSETKEVRTM
jgi:hypothetical protein